MKANEAKALRVACLLANEIMYNFSDNVDIEVIRKRSRLISSINIKYNLNVNDFAYLPKMRG
jgi:hypothetical protein